MWILFIILVLGINIGFARWVYRDAGRKGLPPLLWMWLTITTPGMILAYLVISRRRGRKDRDLY